MCDLAGETAIPRFGFTAEVHPVAVVACLPMACSPGRPPSPDHPVAPGTSRLGFSLGAPSSWRCAVSLELDSCYPFFLLVGGVKGCLLAW